VAFVQVPRTVLKVNGELLTVTLWFGQLVGGILPRISGLDPGALYCGYFCGGILPRISGLDPGALYCGYFCKVALS